MKQKAHFSFVLTFILVTTVLSAQPVCAGGGIVLYPPFDGTYRVTAYFDHDSPNYGTGADNYIWIYNGEQVASSYPNKTGEPYPYDGHDGWDWSMYKEDVLAGADGVVEFVGWYYGLTIAVDHGNNYHTYYSHLNAVQPGISQGTSVEAGQLIGESGDTGAEGSYHLHFGVRHGADWNSTTYATDPFGWRGDGRDPLFDFNGKESSCLWAGVPGDDISCADIIVEDDGTGWEQYPSWDNSCGASSTSWARCNQGNGYRYHWTNVWDPASFYVAWRPWYDQVRYPGYYQIYAFIPSVNATTTNARYQVHHDVTSLTTVSVNQLQVSDDWASLGQYRLWPQIDYVSLYDYTGEGSGSRRIAADALKFSAGIVHLPDVRNSGGWTSSIVIRNNSGSSAQVAINYYNSSGSWVSDQTTTISANGSKTKTPPSGFSGSAVVAASQDVSVVVEQYRSSTGATAAYPGIRANQAATSLALPLIFYNISSAGHTWRTTIVVHNSSAATADVSVAFTPNPDPGIGQSIIRTYDIPPNGRHDFSHYGEFFGSAVLTSDQPVVATVREYSTDYAFASAYPALLPSTAPIQLPLLYKHIESQGDDWYTAFQVQNLGTSSAYIRIRYTCEHSCCGIGNTWTQYAWVSANSAHNFDQRYDGPLPAKFFGAAKVESLPHGQTIAQPIAVVVNQRPLSAGGTTNRLGTYVGEGGGKPIYLPRLQKYVGGGTGWSTAVAVRNAGDQSATIALRYYDAAGNQIGITHSDTIASGRMVNIDQRYDTALSGVGTLDGSGVLTSDQPVVVAVNRRHNPPGDHLCSYNGITP
jgi:murein DD-endopeptidase MepM/ murein hydrolase activator NlpD